MLLAQPLPGEHERVAGRDPEAAHVQAVPQEVPLDPGPHRRRLLLQGLRCSAQTSFKHYVVLNIGWVVPKVDRLCLLFVKFRNILKIRELSPRPPNMYVGC